MDLALEGGIVVLETGETALNIGVRDGRIARLTSDSIDATQTLNVAGLTVLPGLVDEHFHSFWGHGFETHRHATRAAAKGGVTTVVEMPLDIPLTLTAEALDAKNAALAGEYHVDHAAHGGYLRESPDALEAMSAAGAASCKIFTGDVAPPGTYPATTDGEALDAMRRCASLGRPLVVHCENASIVDHETARLIAAGADGAVAWAQARSWFAEVDAVQRMSTLAQATGCRTVIAHNSSPHCLRAIDAARRRGADVWAESCPHLLCVSNEDALDSRFKWNPPTRERAAVEEMWELLRAGLVHTIGSDHGTVPKDPALSVWDQSPGAGNSVETMLAVLSTEALYRRDISLAAVAQLLCTQPAKLFGLYPRKGAVRIGADADFAIVERNGRREIRAADLEFHLEQSRWTPYEGREVRVFPIYTLLRGRLIYADGEVVGSPGDGSYLASEPARVP
jgi:allantoinase